MASAKARGGLKEVNEVRDILIWRNTCDRERELMRVFRDNWGFLLEEAEPATTTQLAATSTVKYVHRGKVSIRRKGIPELNEFAIRPPREETKVTDIVDKTHTLRMKEIVDMRHPMYSTTYQKYGKRTIFDHLIAPAMN